MPVPVLGIVAGDAATPYPSSSISITRGASDNFAVGGGALFNGIGQTAAYGGVAATSFGPNVVSSLLAVRLQSVINPVAGAQDWTLAGPADRWAPAVMTFSGVNTAAPLRGHQPATSSSANPISVTLDTLTADEITIAYVAWYNGGSGTLTATGSTTVRAQGTDGAGLGWALLTSTTNLISFTRTTSSDLALSAAILTGVAGGGAPTFTSITPTNGAVGTSITGSGTNITGATGARTANGINLTGFSVISAIAFTGTIPVGATSGPITLLHPGGNVTGPTFTVTPIFTSLEITNPNSTYTIGVALAPITVRALDQFGNTFLGTLPDCTVSSLSLPITVTGTLTRPFVSGIATFNDLVPTETAAAPTISSISPTSGPIGTEVTFTGTNHTGATALRVNGTLLTGITVLSPTQSRGTIAAGTTSGATSITTPGGTASGPNFTVTTVPVADSLRWVTVPDPIIAGTPYTLEVEAFDSLLNVRATSFTGNITIGIDIAVPVGYEIVSGVLTRTAVAGLATFPSIVFGAVTTPPPGPDPVIDTTRRINFTSAALGPQTEFVAISSAITANIVNLLGATDTAYVTPVQVVIKAGAARLRGTTLITPVAGVVTIPANTISLELDEGVVATGVQLGIDEMAGVTPMFSVSVPVPAATIDIDEKRVPEGDALAVVQLAGPITGGNIQFQGQLTNGVWQPVDLTPYVTGAAANTFTAAFFGRANVTGMMRVRLIKSVPTVAFGSATLNVVQGN